MRLTCTALKLGVFAWSVSVVLVPGERPPTGQALSTARARLVGEPVRAVFEATAGPGREPTPGSHLFGLLATAFDGMVVDLAAEDETAEQFATRRAAGSRRPGGDPGHMRHPPGHRPPPWTRSEVSEQALVAGA
jgi:hypothetical protein